MFVDWVQFSGEAGERFRNASATFCRDQSFAGDRLRYAMRKDQKMASLLSELNSNALCRKLDLKAFLSFQMQRLTKYPLLVEALLKYTSCKPDCAHVFTTNAAGLLKQGCFLVASSQEHRDLQQALALSRSILEHVNAAVTECENKRRVDDLQRRIDRKPCENSEHHLVKVYKVRPPYSPTLASFSCVVP